MRFESRKGLKKSVLYVGKLFFLVIFSLLLFICTSKMISKASNDTPMIWCVYKNILSYECKFDLGFFFLLLQSIMSCIFRQCFSVYMWGLGISVEECYTVINILEILFLRWQVGNDDFVYVKGVMLTVCCLETVIYVPHMISLCFSIEFRILSSSYVCFFLLHMLQK